jgi:pentatricopeptide repeat protein
VLQYGDHILALRILVECLAKLNRLDHVERMLDES